MMKMKFGGWVLTGLGAYLIAGKVVKMVGKAVEDISTASKWKAYYKAFGKTGRSDMSVPEEKVVYVEKDAEGSNLSPSTEHLKDVIADSIQKATDALLEKQKGVNDPLEGQREASEGQECGYTDGDDAFDEEANCPKVTDPEKFMQYVQNCQEKRMSDAEIAISLGMSINVYRKYLADALNILREHPYTEEKEPMYADDLYDGVKVVDPEGEDE